jgi:hypothetical protein
MLFPFLSSLGQNLQDTYMGDPNRPNMDAFKSKSFLTEDDISYTGDVNFSIPLLNLPERHIHDFGINLQYNSNISQRQLASWVGLGWNLELGAIQRTIVGRCDEQDSSDYLPEGGYLLDQQMSRAHFQGKLKYEHSRLPVSLQDKADRYVLMLDGGQIELLPYLESTGELIFLSVSYKPWNIRADVNAGRIWRFMVTKEDGTVYTFDAMDYVTVDGTHVSGKHQEFRYPYRWNLTKIEFPDGCKIRIAYKIHNDEWHPYTRSTESISIDRSWPTEEMNLFGLGGVVGCRGTVEYEYSCPDTIYSDTHYAKFWSVSPSEDETERNRRLDSIVVRDRYTNRELYAALFAYSAFSNNGDENDFSNWQVDERLNSDQLTLTQIQIGNTESVLEEPKIPFLPPYSFSYYCNPKIDPEDLTYHSQSDPLFPVIIQIQCTQLPGD